MQQVTEEAPQSANRRDRHRAETQERILQAALDLFGRQSFQETTIEQITEAADVGKGTFFNYFPSKEYVVAKLVETRFVAPAQAVLAQGIGFYGSVQATLHALFDALMAVSGQSASLSRNMLAIHLAHDEPRNHVVSGMSESLAKVNELIAEGQHSGEVRSDCPATDLVRLFFALHAGAMVMWSMEPAANGPDWFERVFDHLWTGFAART